MSNKSIGSILLESGKLTSEQVQSVHSYQQSNGIRFGDAAVEMGYLSKDEIKFAISQQFDFSYLSPENSKVDTCLISAFFTEGPQIEAFKNLRSQLNLRWLDDNQSLVVCSPESGCGSSYVAANLAVLFAQSGKKTLLVDVNFRHASQHLCFGDSNQMGLSQVLARRSDLDVIKPIEGLKNLNVLFSGVMPPNPLELLERGRLPELKLRLEQDYDVIIYDAPPVNQYSDTFRLADVMKGLLLVVKKNDTKISDLKRAKYRLQEAGVEPVGVAINDFKRRKK